MSPAMIVLLVFLMIVVVLGMVLFFLSRYAKQSGEEMRARFPDAELIVPGANFFGQESSGVMQLRGNGTLVITPQEIYFQMWVTRREYRIPRAAIQAIETPRSFLGKSQLSPLLRVNFMNEQGQMDAMAWSMRDVEAARRILI